MEQRSAWLFYHFCGLHLYFNQSAWFYSSKSISDKYPYTSISHEYVICIAVCTPSHRIDKYCLSHDAMAAFSWANWQQRTLHGTYMTESCVNCDITDKNIHTPWHWWSWNGMYTIGDALKSPLTRISLLSSTLINNNLELLKHGYLNYVQVVEIWRHV